MAGGDLGGALGSDPAPQLPVGMGRVLSIPGARSHPASWVVCRMRSLWGGGAGGQTLPGQGRNPHLSVPG